MFQIDSATGIDDENEATTTRALVLSEEYVHPSFSIDKSLDVTRCELLLLVKHIFQHTGFLDGKWQMQVLS